MNLLNKEYMNLTSLLLKLNLFKIYYLMNLLYYLLYLVKIKFNQILFHYLIIQLIKMYIIWVLDFMMLMILKELLFKLIINLIFNKKYLNQQKYFKIIT